MSNIEKNLHYKPPVNFYQEQHKQSQQEINVSNLYNDKSKRHFNDSKSDNFLDGNGIIKKEIHDKPYCYQEKSESKEISTPASNTILITTHNYSSQMPTATKHLGNSKSSSSSITIVTHNSSGSLSATTTTNNGTTSIKSTNGECITGSYQKTLSGHSGSNSPVVLEGINILINNHFNEPSCSSINSIDRNNIDSCNQSSNIININSKSIDIMDQKKHVNSTSEIIKETDTIKSEKSDIQTEPDSTTNGLSPEKSLILKTSNSNSDTGFGSSSSFCSSNSSNSSCISNESTNNSYKQQKIYNFAKNMDVLVQKKDGKFYLGIIKDVYAVDGKCLINFDDNSEYLADFDELKRLGSDSETESSPMCVACKKYNENDVVESCEKCLRGYHRMCAEGGYKNGIWTCKMCATENGVKTPEKNRLCLNSSNPHIRQVNLPYDIKSLSWDNKHRINNEEVYCYCGNHGRWDNKMLQCIKCLQWFHEKCVKCLLYPLLNGDRFYVFVCCICNHGTEIYRRLKFSWVDLVHLLLYNLTKLENDKKYHHVTKTITPFAVQHWANLQLSISMNNLSPKEIQKKIVNVLNNSRRFKSGKETKKGLVYWGLRIRMPPAVPKILIPKGTTKITDQFLKSVLKLKFLSPAKKLKYSNLESEDEPFIDDNDSKYSSDLKFSSEDEIPIKAIIQKESLENKIKSSVESEQQKLNKEQEFLQQEQKEQSRRKKKHTFYPRLPNILTIDKGDYNSITNISNNITVSNNNEKTVGLTADMNLCCDSSDDNSSLGPLDLRIPPPKNFFGRNNPFRQITPKKNQDSYNKFNSGNNKKHNLAGITTGKLNFNAINHKHLINDGNKSIDLSSKLVALKKSSVNLFNCGLPSDFQTAGQFRIVRTIKRRLSARDLVIGPNQEIKRRRLRRSSGCGNVEVISTSIQSFSSSKSKNNIIATYPAGKSFNFNSMSGLSSKSVLNIPSSATFSKISPGINSVSTTSNSTLATSPTSVDTTNVFSKFSNVSSVCSNQQLQQRNLRKRDDKNYAENRRNSNSSTNNHLNSNTTGGNTSNTSCNIVVSECNSSRNNSFEHQTEEELSDLQTSVNLYFGAVERIRNGEKFIVRGKRTLANGKIQYLMEWEGCAQAGQ